MSIRRRNELLLPVIAGALLAASSCADGSGGAPHVAPIRQALDATSLPSVRFSEIHYDNTGTDTGEAIEISGPAGMDVTGWTIVLYNGNGAVTYNTQTLSGTIPATCGDRGVIVVNYPTNGIQNGGSSATPTTNPADSDGMALVDASGAVVEFLSYEGTMTAANGPASGLLSTDIIAQEPSTTPIGQSLSRDAFN